MNGMIDFKTYQQIKMLLLSQCEESKNAKTIKKKLRKFKKEEILETKDIMIENGYVFQNKLIHSIADL